MKVAVLSRVAYPLHGVGGFERHVGAMVRHLVRKGVEVTLYTAPSISAAGPHNIHRSAPSLFARELAGADGSGSPLEGARIEFVPYRVLPWPRRHGFVIADRSTNYLVWSVPSGSTGDRHRRGRRASGKEPPASATRSREERRARRWLCTRSAWRSSRLPG